MFCLDAYFLMAYLLFFFSQGGRGGAFPFVFLPFPCCSLFFLPFLLVIFSSPFASLFLLL